MSETYKPKKTNNHKRELAQGVRAYIQKHSDRRVTLEELCREFDYSGTYIKSCFRQQYGEPIASYERRFKMKEACRLLRHSDRGVLEIAGMLGYENGSKFADAFRRVVGVTPGVFRRLEEPEAQRLQKDSLAGI